MSIELTDILEYYDDKALSVEQLEKVSGLKVYEPQDLLQYNTLENMFSSLGDRILVIFLSKPNFGHFTCFTKQSDSQCCFYESYGLQPDKLLSLSAESLSRMNNTNIFETLSANSSMKLSFNSHVHQLQTRSDFEQTCGYHSSLRCKLYRMSNEEYDYFLKSSKMHPDYFGIICHLSQILP